MSGPRYFDLFSKEIDKQKWEELREHFKSVYEKHGENEPDSQPLDPFSIREYRNEILCVKLVWNGEIVESEVGNLYKSMYPVFKVLIMNKRDGEWRVEPMQHSYFKRIEANNKFEDILITYTQSYYDEDDNFLYDEKNLSQCIHEKITEDILEENDLPSITYKPQTEIDDAW